MMIRRDVRDSSARQITVTRVRMTKDLQQARVYFTTHADAAGPQQASFALRRARSFLKRQLGQRLRLRHVPELTFLHDNSVERQDRVAQLLDQFADELPSELEDHEPQES